jgi:hypothetical protein
MSFLIITQVPLFVKGNVENKFCPLRAFCIITRGYHDFLRIVKRAGKIFHAKGIKVS